MEENEMQEKQQSEGELRRRAAEALLERGVVFVAERRGVLRHWRRKMRLRVDPPTLGVLYAVAGEFAALRMDERRMEADPIGYGFALVREQVRPMARAVACAVLGSRWKIGLFCGWYARYLMWQLTPGVLLKLLITVLSVSGTADFINSIRLIKGTGLLDGGPGRTIE